MVVMYTFRGLASTSVSPQPLVGQHEHTSSAEAESKTNPLEGCAMFLRLKTFRA